MSNSPSNGDDLLTFIAATIESMRDQMATKNDLAGMASKADLAGMASKADLAGMASKADLAALRDQVEYTGGQVETMRDQMATSSDIARLEAKLVVETTAIRGDIEQLHLRLDSI